MTTKQTKVIKRYANRKLYDTERSCYVTLDEIAHMIKEGDEVRVIDNKSKDDLTAVTLAQIIVEEEKKVAKMPLKLLRSIIQSGNEAVTDFYQKRVADPVQALRDDVQTRVGTLFNRDGTALAGAARSDDGAAGAAGSAEPGANDDAAGATAHADGGDGGASTAKDAAANGDGVVKEFVSSATETFESWQKRVDERVKDALAKVAPGAARASEERAAQSRVEIDALRAKVDALEAKILALEAKRA